MTYTTTYEINHALKVLRAGIKRNPALAAAILDGMSKEVAVNVLQSAQKELATLLTVSQAMTAAAAALTKLDTPSKD